MSRQRKWTSFHREEWTGKSGFTLWRDRPSRKWFPGDSSTYSESIIRMFGSSLSGITACLRASAGTLAGDSITSGLQNRSPAPRSTAGWTPIFAANPTRAIMLPCGPKSSRTKQAHEFGNGSPENMGLINQEHGAREDAKARRKKKQTDVREIA